MNKPVIKIASRKSPMAWQQAEQIKGQLSALNPHAIFELRGFSTQGDQNTQRVLAEIGGKDLFVKELQYALLCEDADLAVHCIKDMSVKKHAQLDLAVVCQRDDPRDAVVSNQSVGLEQLPAGSIIGTASPRRQAQLLYYYPHLKVKMIRGNVNSRLQKLTTGEYDALILAAAGMKRLNMQHLISEYLDLERFIPAIGQGALGIECRQGDNKVLSLITGLNDPLSNVCIQAERAVNRVLGGSCFVPIGAYATIESDRIHLMAMVADVAGTTMIQDKLVGHIDAAEQLGEQLAYQLRDQGALQLWAK